MLCLGHLQARDEKLPYELRLGLATVFIAGPSDHRPTDV